MGFLNRLRFVRDVATDERFSTPIPELTMVDGVITANKAGSQYLPVGRAAALGVPAVLRGRNLICSIATLPLVQYDPSGVPVRSALFDQIETGIPNVVTLAMLVEDLLLDGIGWWHVTERGWNGFPTKVERVAPNRVHLQQPPGGQPLSHLPSGIDPKSAVWIDQDVIPGSDMIRFDSPQPALLVAARRAIRRAVALENAAEMYASNPRPADYFTPKDGYPEQPTTVIEDALDAWDDSRQDNATAYVPGFLTYNGVDSPSPRDLQLAELQARAALDIANAIGLDPEDLGVSTTSRTYQNVTDRRIDRINDVLSMFMRAVTDRLSMNDVTRQGYRVAFDLTDYLRADPTTRTTYYQAMRALGAMVPSEIRAAEGLPPLTAAQQREIAESEPTPEPAPEEPMLNTLSFEGDEPTRVTFELGDFKADATRRTVSGTLIPFGAVGRNAQGKWRFSPGSVEWNRSAISRVKLNRDHVRTDLLGAAIDLRETDAGIASAFKVARGPAGDQALSEAEDQVLDGLSAEVDILDFAPDPEDETVNLVSRARLTGAALTASPAFDDARLTKVAASTTAKGTVQMDTATEQTAPAAPAAPAVALTLADVRRVLDEALTARPELVTPHRTRPGEGVTRNELPYRFGEHAGRGEHSFCLDISAALRSDGAAGERLEKFVQAAFAVAKADVDELNPNRNRADLYVDQREYGSPVWDSINKGAVTDATPFTVPKFNSAATLVADHVEGTEPSLGSFTTTGQTITPAPVSGKVEVNRETLDQGGNPQVDTLIWRQMQRAWYESLEAKAVAVLDNATPTGITLTTGATGTTLTNQLEGEFALLQFARGGFSMDTMFLHVDLYKALAGAADSTGRKVYPILGPTNANGQTVAKFRYLDIAGVTAYPSWALGATGSVAESSYLFDRERVHGWTSAPRRLDFDIQVKSVYVGLWGYAATAITDINGVREVIYDPVV